MRRLNKTEIKSLGNMSIADKESLLPKYARLRIKKMLSYKRALKIINMDCQKRDRRFGEKGGENAYDRAWKTWHRLYESAIKKTPKLFIEKLTTNKVARSKYTAEDVEIFRTYVYNSEIDMWDDEGYGPAGGEEKAEPWLKARRKTILDEIFWLFETDEITEMLIMAKKV